MGTSVEVKIFMIVKSAKKMAKNHEKKCEDKGRLGKKLKERYPDGDIPDCSSGGHRQGDTPLQHRQARGHTLATQTGGRIPFHNTDR